MRVLLRPNSAILLSRSEGSSYDAYFTEDASRRCSKLRVISFLLSLVIVTLLYKVLILNQPNEHYSRKFDNQLQQYIVSSKAASNLPRSGQLFCWVQTTEMYHTTRALAINETWLHRCDHGQLFTSKFFNDSNIPYSTVFAGIPESYYNLFFKSRFAFHYIWTQISPDFEWYMKADDDTYVVVEHLKSYLSTLDHTKPYYLGFILRPYLPNGYNAGGAGYVLSREALRLFNERLYHNETLCPDDIYEDVGIARCLSNIDIFPHDTRNGKNQNRFNTYSPSDVFHASKSNARYTWFQEGKGYEAFANDFISFHHLTPDEIRLFDILLYRTHRGQASTASGSVETPPIS